MCGWWTALIGLYLCCCLWSLSKCWLTCSRSWRTTKNKLMWRWIPPNVHKWVAQGLCDLLSKKSWRSTVLLSAAAPAHPCCGRTSQTRYLPATWRSCSLQPPSGLQLRIFLLQTILGREITGYSHENDIWLDVLDPLDQSTVAGHFKETGHECRATYVVHSSYTKYLGALCWLCLVISS